MTLYNILTFISSFVLSLVLVALFLHIARRYDIMDDVGDSIKIHKTPVPYLGGVGFGIAFLLSVMLGLALNAYRLDGLLIVFGCVVIVGVLGLIDDLVGLKPGIRLFVQTAVAASIWLAGFQVNFVPMTLASFVATAVLVVGTINAINMLDGLDGLAAGIVALSGLGFWVVFYTNGFEYHVLPLALVGVLLGFLVFNFNPARIFMGDAGSYFLGLLVALFAINVLQQPGDFRSLLGVLLITGVPIVDAFYTILGRKVKGHSAVQGDRNHLYDHLHRAIGSVRKTVLRMYLFQLLSVSIGVWLLLR